MIERSQEVLLTLSTGLQIRHFEKKLKSKKLTTQGKNSIIQQKNSRI